MTRNLEDIDLRAALNPLNEDEQREVDEAQDAFRLSQDAPEYFENEYGIEPLNDF